MCDSRVMEREEWVEALIAHEQRLSPWADAFVARRSRGEKNPVHDFLFTYYSFAPAKLKQWVPALNLTLLGVKEEDFDSWPWLGGSRFSRNAGSLELSKTKLDERARSTANWIASLCEGILTRPARFRCFGLHEWAMVYKQTDDEIRHAQYSLRLRPNEVEEFVKSQALCCTHYDAFRFFTEEARPMNSFNPTLDSRQTLEQGGCLHANMDLYKWATKLWPWVGADLISDAFFLAMEGRDLDMRASPYDLRALGYEPLCIETAVGREQYEQEQKVLAERARFVRQKLQIAALAIAGA